MYMYASLRDDDRNYVHLWLTLRAPRWGQCETGCGGWFPGLTPAIVPVAHLARYGLDVTPLYPRLYVAQVRREAFRWAAGYFLPMNRMFAIGAVWVGGQSMRRDIPGQALGDNGDDGWDGEWTPDPDDTRNRKDVE